MRTINKTLGGKDFTLTANFAASKLIADQVCDPLEIARESAAESYFLEAGIPYTPRFKFSIENVVRLLTIATGAERKELEEAVFDEGFIAAKDICVEYLGLIIGPGPSELKPSTKESAPKEKSSGSNS